MNAQDLKNSILQLAVQGMLVEQRSEEGTAKELLEQIKTEKEKLIKEKKIKKEKPLPEITEDEIPFEIPSSWKWVRLGQIISIESGKGLTSSTMKEGRVPVFGGNGITGYHNEALVHKATVVIGRVGFYCGSVHLTPKEAWVTDNAFITTFPENSIDREYLIYMLRHMNLGKSHNATAQPVVSGKKIYPLLFPLPPLAEQKRIVAKIEEILPYIDQYDKAYTKLETFNKKFPEDMKKSILQLAMQGKLVEQRPEEGTADELYKQIIAEKAQLIKDGKIKKEKSLPEVTEDEIPFEIPSSWRWVRLGAISAKLTDGSHNPPPNTGIGYCVISAKNIKNGEIVFGDDERFVDEEGFIKENPRTNITRGDIIMGIIGGSIGNLAIYNHDRKVIAQRSAAIIDTMIDNRFCMNVLQSSFCQSKMKNSSGTAQGGVYLGTLKNLLIPLPPLAEQKRIIAKIEELLPYCDQLVK